MEPYGIMVDGVHYSVNVDYATLVRQFEIIEGDNGGRMISGRKTRDLIGTGYSYTMTLQPDQRYIDDYDALYQVLSAPVESHMITVPYGQGSISFEAMIESGSDTYMGSVGGKQIWKGLNISFKCIEPYRQ